MAILLGAGFATAVMNMIWAVYNLNWHSAIGWLAASTFMLAYYLTLTWYNIISR